MNDTAVTIFLIFATSLASAFTATNITENRFKREAIEQGCAQYNQQTAEFEWLTREVQQ